MPAGLQEGGVRILSGSTVETLERNINDFLAGDSTTDAPKKYVSLAPTLTVSGGVFYALIVYTIIGNVGRQ